ncbi:DUF1491 family protein [Sphingomonas sp. RHCKR47]|uniref:DUF1491 family protein n=1 Tax=Sphingomonas citricola TaxID=2862498 RepID=UPI001C684473|nr:DUF1491 family protein [Sphingomonas citricola]MBW6524256.1 DUF1491 family protein [Sphingomonas citricola]
MSGRLPTHVAVGALVRRVNDAGGLAVVRARGEAQTGAILLLIDDGDTVRGLERFRDLDDRESLVPAGPTAATGAAMDEYWKKRRVSDPDLWVVELMIAQAERFAAETILAD